MSLKHTIKLWYYHKIKHFDDAEIRKRQLIKNGALIGNQTYIFSDYIETSEPYLITIGDNCIISPNVMFTTHDASAKYYVRGASDLFGRITIGNNVFIGMGAIILPGVTIADNCIIGAGSVVTKSCLNPNRVLAGNPAKVISTIDKMREKYENNNLNTWGMSFDEKKEYLLSNEVHFKG